MNMKNTKVMLGPLRKGVPAIVTAFVLVVGCNSGVNGNGDTGSDTITPDTIIPDYFTEWDTVIPDGGEDFVCPAPCAPAGAQQCNGDIIEVCSVDAYACMVWQVLRNCADTDQACDDSGDIPVCVTPETCDDDIMNQDETDVDCGGDICPPCATGGECIEDEDCMTGVCDDGMCKLCRAGSYHCFGNWLRLCSADGSSWDDVDHCDAFSGYVCNPVEGVCEPAEAIGLGPDSPTGEYYRYAHFTTADSVFLGGADVDSLDDRIYVNRDGSHVDVYSITLLDSDGDTLMERNQHPDNPANTGPIEERVLTFIETIDIPIGATHNNELYITPDSIIFTKSTSEPGDIFKYDFGAGTVTPIVDVSTGIWNQVLGYDEVNHLWYSAVPYERWVFSYDPIENEWVMEFVYPNLSGDHSDGMEVVTDPRTGIPYIYCSDMTSNFIAQYRKDDDGMWVQENLFSYNNPDPEHVEGMGFGALGHFWVTNEGYGVPDGTNGLYEIGGGDMDEFLN